MGDFTQFLYSCGVKAHNNPNSDIMKMKIFTFLAILFLVCPLLAQETVQPKTNTLEEQFVEVIDESNNYEQYKVINRNQINKLRQNILDSVAALEAKISETQAEIDTQTNTISTLEDNLETTQEDLARSKEKENGIEIFGVLTEKATYNTIMWSIIGILLVALGFFIYKFKNSHSVTKAAQLKLAETEIEFEKHRQKKLEEQQQLRRKLQDEINKNRKS